MSADLEMLTVSETALLLRLTEQTTYRMIRAGDIPALRFGGAIRIPRRSIEGLIEAASAAVSATEPAVPETAAIS